MQAIRSLQPDILIFDMWDPDTRWVGNEDGYAPLNNEYVVDHVPFSMLQTNDEALDESKFLPAECDCKLRSTWFDCEHNENTIKQRDELIGMYEMSVGRGANFLLNIGPNCHGRINDADVRMILIKNPAGCNQVLNFLTQRTEPFVFAACLNDRAQDGKDVSWIWDVDFERLTAMEKVLSDIYVSGVRADDMALRFLYAGFPKERIHVQKDYAQLMEEATGKKLPVFVMPTYTAMLALRGTIAKRYGYKEFWQ